jgi:ABC-type lipoprotein release transport system permease subunit
VTFAASGVAIGVVVACIAARWVEPLLFGESGRDPFVFIVVAAMMSAVSLLASTSPALRATRADPMEALRAA